MSKRLDRRRILAASAAATSALGAAAAMMPAARLVVPPAVVASALGTIATATKALAQSSTERRTLINAHVVGIVGARRTGTMTELAEDLQLALNDDELRILPILGRGSVGNIEDLLYLRGVDLALVQSDVLNYFLANKIEDDITERIRYIASVGTQKAHMLVRDDIQNIDHLYGGRVNIGFPNSGSQMSGGVLLQRLGMNVEASEEGHRTALRMLKNRELDGMFLMGGAPMPVLQGISRDDGIKLIEVPYHRVLDGGVYADGGYGDDGTYRISALFPHEYPDLISEGENVETVEVDTVLAAYNFDRSDPRHANIVYFNEKLRDSAEKLRTQDYHIAWTGLDFPQTIPGWTKFS